MKKPSQHLIAEVPRKRGQVELTIGIDLGDVWSHYCTLNQQGEVINRGRFRTTPKAINTWFTDVPHARVAMGAGVHSIWISEQLEQLGHEVIVANVRELRAISHSDRKSDDVDAEKLARYARLDPEILRPISHRTVEQQEALTLIRARELLVRLRTASINAVRGLTKACGYRMPASSTKCFAQRGQAAMPPGLKLALGPILTQIAEMTLKIKQYDKDIQRLTQTEYVETQAMMTIHGIGHITALTFVLTVPELAPSFEVVVKPSHSLLRASCRFQGLPRVVAVCLQPGIEQHTAIRLGTDADRSFASQGDESGPAEQLPQFRYRLLCGRNQALYKRHPDILRPDGSDHLPQPRVRAIAANRNVGHGRSPSDETQQHLLALCLRSLQLAVPLHGVWLERVQQNIS